MDEMGYPNQALRPFMRPLDDTLSFVGRARTGLYAETYSVLEGENPYELEIRLVDDLKAGDVAVFACGGPTDRIAPWGELLTTAAMARGAAGCVTDGLVRDVRHIRRMKFPVFHGGIGPLDSKGRSRMIEMDRPIVCAGVRVCSGDTVFGDVDASWSFRRRFRTRCSRKRTTRRREKAAPAKSSMRGACCRKFTKNMAFSEEPCLERMGA
jgi:regulator of RNase E activity RraA